MRKKFLIPILLVVMGVGLLSLRGLVEYNSKTNEKFKENETNFENTNLNIDLANIPEDKKIYINSESAFYYEPNIENLYKYADLIIVGSFSKITGTVVDIDRIETKSEFNINKILKNNLNADIKDSLNIKILGGAMPLPEYLEKSENTLSNFSNIKEADRSQYYVIQQAPNLNLAKGKEYLLFLNFRNDELGLNSLYYGIREIQDGKIYDYNSKEFIESTINLQK